MYIYIYTHCIYVLEYCVFAYPYFPEMSRKELQDTLNEAHERLTFLSAGLTSIQAKLTTGFGGKKIVPLIDGKTFLLARKKGVICI